MAKDKRVMGGRGKRGQAAQLGKGGIANFDGQRRPQSTAIGRARQRTRDRKKISAD